MVTKVMLLDKQKRLQVHKAATQPGYTLIGYVSAPQGLYWNYKHITRIGGIGSHRRNYFSDTADNSGCKFAVVIVGLIIKFILARLNNDIESRYIPIG
jgi:hypothetical protein